MLGYSHAHLTKGLLFDRRQISDLHLVIGAQFDAHDWTCAPKIDFSTALDRRIRQLRSKYDYVRLWYSGGQDSGIILRHCFDNKILIDEICICSMRMMPDDPGSQETDRSALPKALQYKQAMPQCKITHWQFVPEMFSPRPIDAVRGLEFSSQRHPGPDFYGVINPVWRILQQPKNYCDLMGFVAPHIQNIGPYTEFYFVDKQFNSVWPSIEHLSPSDDCPELTHTYIHTVLQKIDLRPGQCLSGGSREHKLLLPEFQLAHPCFTMSKHPEAVGAPLDSHRIWLLLKQQQGTKDYMRICHWWTDATLRPTLSRWLRFVDYVIDHLDTTGVISKKYKLQQVDQ